VYIKINSSGFSSVKVPDLIEKTYREAVPTLKALGLEEGTITYIPNPKDMVLRYTKEEALAGKKS
jgi:beta-lactam-binding protein with PASTA domain